ncbi:MAG: HAD-IIIC family phosphatase [Alphaproteobacteria bacterium]
MALNDEKRAALRSALCDPFLMDRPIDELRKLAKRLPKVDAGDLPSARTVRIAVTGGYLTDYLCEVLPLFLRHRGLDATLFAAPYGTLFAQSLDPDSDLHRFDADLAILLPYETDLQSRPDPAMSGNEVDEIVNDEVARWASLWDRISVPIVMATFPAPAMRPMGEADGLLPGGTLHFIRRLNAALSDAAPGHVSLVDMEAVSSELGRALSRDDRLYRLAKQPFSMDAIPAIANRVAAAAAARLGTARKALILDLDNTLWGGVIGDQGLAGIELGPETPNGESFVAFQTYIKALAQRGIVLGVCSKNLESTALEPFVSHDAMVLQQQDIACFVANFENKADNIRTIAQTLNLGLDAFVFVDDSPVECALLRRELPQVWTIELSGDPAEFPWTLDRAIPFPISRITAEDRTRADSYRAMATIRQAETGASDMEGFLKSLAPVAVDEGVRPDTIARITQLIAKTNQFKLNPDTFSEAEITDRKDHVIALRLKDSIQDHGIVAVAVTEPEDDALRIRNWVMSCRVFSRRLEYLTRAMFRDAAKAAGKDRLRLTYAPSGRNGLIEDLLPKLGFTRSDNQNEFESMADMPDTTPDHYMTLEKAER